ncbi:hypothetical protein PsorP6_016301 [Peronosclerospora sorghi]|uniref:Uncharacterized protein n=1 Tax=Peronosclerospora sorghi TaxID=230839 RepID=A0ACC0VN74_9STRA|nr:hypothetical protein PsorP6_016301 [Peronosclerospora sorghi]
MENVRFQATALQALQKEDEIYITHLLEDTNLLEIHGKRVTIPPKDMELPVLVLAEDAPLHEDVVLNVSLFVFLEYKRDKAVEQYYRQFKKSQPLIEF